MKLKQLESHLSEVDIFKTPKISLEQYPTSAHIASRMIYTAEQTYDDIGSATVVDLGTYAAMTWLEWPSRPCEADLSTEQAHHPCRHRRHQSPRQRGSL